MLIIDNINKTVKEDLQAGIQKGSKMSVAAACFSIYAYQELKKLLEGIEELRFIFTSPTFITEKASKAQREFYIPRISRECSLYGTEFEVKLRNELTQKAIAKECADWIRRKVVFKSNVTQEQMMGFMTVDESTYMPINGFTTVDLGCERGNNAYYPVQKTESFENANYFLKLFEQLWNDKKKLQEVTDVVIENISAAYRENAPEYIYFVALYNIFKEFLDDISEDELPNEATGFKESKIWGMLYNFQRDAVLAIISKLEKFNGCILADSVGLGKTFTALAVMLSHETNMSLDDYCSIIAQCRGRTFQIALGGAGDPNKHESFAEILRATRENRIVPNYTTSGYDLTDREIELTKKYCGAVAVSFYSNIDKNGNEDNPPTITAIERFVKAGCITNIHYVLSKKSIREAVYRVKNGAFPKGINAVVFLLYKPVGLASQDYVIGYDDPDYLELLRLVTSIDCNWKYGFDTCQSPAIYKFAPGVAIESIEFCEAARFSMYINSRCIAFPCSFGIGDDTFSVNLKQHSLQEAWESESFAKFREKQTKVCTNCTTGICRSCGLELVLNLCGNIKGNLQ